MTVAGPDAETVLLARATELTGLPVVSITEGEALADVKDVVYAPDAGRIVSVTLNKRGGLFAGPMKTALPLESIIAIGRNAVMVESSHVLDEAPSAGSSGVDSSRNVLGNDVLSDAGDRLGEVTDLIVVTGAVAARMPHGPAVGDVVGYQVRGDEALQGRAGAQLFIPLPYTFAVSGSALLVPAQVEPFIRDDLSGFGAAVEQFRAQLGRPDGGQPLSSQPPPPAGPPLGGSPPPFEPPLSEPPLSEPPLPGPPQWNPPVDESGGRA